MLFGKKKQQNEDVPKKVKRKSNFLTTFFKNRWKQFEEESKGWTINEWDKFIFKIFIVRPILIYLLIRALITNDSEKILRIIIDILAILGFN